ncbi:MAG: hypothetical protein ABR498_00620 [Candidatus Dormibacteria bacterium]
MTENAGAITGALPPLPDVVAPEQLRTLADADIEVLELELRGSERSTVAAMSPWDRQLREIRSRLAELATERRRRERAAHVAQRSSAREQAKSGTMPTLADALAAPDDLVPSDTALSALQVYLKSGGEVGLGFATRPGTIAFTDGRRQQQAKTWGEARSFSADGWDPGSAGVPGVRVHLVGSRVERVVAADEIVVASAQPV